MSGFSLHNIDLDIKALFTSKYGFSVVAPISITVPFLNMTKQFVGNIGQVSHQINAVVMGIAGAKRIFDLMDQEVEVDNGYVTLVNITNEDGQIKECQHRTGLWAWKHPHKSDNTITYTLQTGNIVLDDVDFQYEESKPVFENKLAPVANSETETSNVAFPVSEDALQ